MKTELLNLLFNKGKLLHLPKDTSVFFEGDLCQNFVVLTKGQIKVFKTSDKGKELILYRVSPDNLCVLTTTCILSNSNYSANAITESDIEGIALTKQEFDQLIIESLDFRELVFSSLSNRFNTFVEKIDEVVFQTLKERLKNFLSQNKILVNDLKMTHQEIAAELGTDREVISRLITQIKKESGLV